MADANLAQADADALIALAKYRIDEAIHEFPGPGDRICVPLKSLDGHEQFLLDVSKGRIDIAKVKYQNRARQTVILVRLDVVGAPHTNPDGVEMPCPHIHLYREGYGTKWAFRIPVDRFTNPLHSQTTLSEFMAYCNVVVPPFVNFGLFS